MTGHRAVVTGKGVVEMQPFQPPDPGPGEVLIRTRASLISPGTERAFFLALPTTNPTYPLYPGYSNIGEVIAVGDGVEALKVGDRVASGTAHASHVIAPAEKCIPVPAGLADDAATFFNLIAIAMQGVRKTHIEIGEAAAVMGVGPIGVFAMQLVRTSGAIPVIAVDKDPARLALAESLGADEAFAADDKLVENVLFATRGKGVNVVIEATGAPAAILSAFQIAAVRGRVSLLGSARGETERVNFYRDVHRKGLNLIGAHEITRARFESLPGWWTQWDEQDVGLRMLATGRLHAAPLISHRFGWGEFTDAYELLRSWDTAATGMIISWED